jgi:penicillin-binding protein 1B
MNRAGARRRSRWQLAAFAAGAACVVAFFALAGSYRRMAIVVDEKFAGRRWDFPSRIFSDEFLVHPGLDVDAAGLGRRLERLSYRDVDHVPAVGGEVRWGPSTVEIALRPGAPGRRSTRRVAVSLDGRRIAAMRDLDSEEAVPAFALEAEELTGIWAGDWEQRRAIHVVDVAPILVRAVLVTEDSRFFDHRGIDVVGIGRAAIANLRSGRVRQGGSTLTQQLMKNFFLTTDRTLARKLREVAMALVAERRYSKMQILEAYLNEIYIGQRGARGIFGVAEASRFYFGKAASDLTLPEAALIAGLIRAPNAYSPYQNPEKALERRATVLRLLFEAGEIEQQQLDEARAAPLGVVERSREGEPNEASYFVDLVKSEIEGRFPADLLTTEGLQIYTTLDPLLQEQATRAVEAGLTALEREHPRLAHGGDEDRLEGALVAIKPHTGEIRALVGGRSYQASQFDRVTKARRQPGSAFKPIVYLAGMLANGPAHVTPATILDDAPFAWVVRRRSQLDAEQRRRPLPWARDGPARARAVSQRGDGPGGARRRALVDRRPGTHARHREPSPRRSRDRPRRRRGDAARAHLRVRRVRERRNARRTDRDPTRRDARRRADRRRSADVGRRRAASRRLRADARPRGRARPGNRAGRAARRLRASGRRQDRNHPTTTATRGSSGTRPTWSPASGWASTRTRRSGSAGRARRCRSGRTS